jgi:curli biogenesis system outer membrane secretion channel CsgG
VANQPIHLFSIIILITGMHIACLTSNASTIMHGGAMFHRLLSMLIQEVPEEISVCEFECPMATCTASNRATCSIRNRTAHNVDVDIVSTATASADDSGLDVIMVKTMVP